MSSFNTINNDDGVPTWIGFRSSWMFHPESERASKLSISLSLCSGEKRPCNALAAAPVLLLLAQ
jgi:hypothetical protein